MLLLIDAGNTRIKWAVTPLDSPLSQWMAEGAVTHADAKHLVASWQPLNIDAVIVSNVAGRAMQTLLEQLLSRSLGPLAPKPHWFASVSLFAGVRNGYRDPTQLGCDRFASAIAAVALYPNQPLIVATCGTASTVDAISSDGVFLGGMILPGLDLMASALARNTAQLPQVESTTALASVFADHTDAAIASGCIAAQAGAIERAFSVHPQASSIHRSNLRCVLSGGAAQRIAPHLTLECNYVENLVLIGLQTAAIEYNASC